MPVYFTETPHPYSVCYRVLHRLGIRYRLGAPEKAKAALVFLWKDATFAEALCADNNNWAVVNGRCLDISKERVERIHHDVFGYSLAVDPLTHNGRMVEKSNLNGAHDGREIIGPLQEATPGAVYQRIVSNIPPERLVRAMACRSCICDFRVPVFNGAAASFLYIKIRPRESRFSNTNTLVCLADTSSIFAPSEVSLIASFCQVAGLDYGEIDIVRDSQDDRVYVLDINKTPLGPPNGLSHEDVRRALALYESSFLAWFERMNVLEAPSRT